MLSRVHGVLDEQARLRLLLDAVVTMAADLTLDGVLSRIVAIASTLVDAQYAALGVLDVGPERRLRTFVHHGMSSDAGRARSVSCPPGTGCWACSSTSPRPIRLHDIAAHPASYGFPEHHPPMSSFLGVPVRIRDRVFGNLYLTEKAGGGDFTDEDENIVIALAAAAGVAIENARLYEEAEQRAALAGGDGRDHRAAGRRLRRARTPCRWSPTGPARCPGPTSPGWWPGPTRTRLELRVVSGCRRRPRRDAGLSMEQSLASEVVRSGEAGLGAATSPPTRGPWTRRRSSGWPQLGPAIVVPMRVRQRRRGGARPGVDPRARRAASTPSTPALPASFAEQAALAIQVARAREDQQRLALLRGPRPDRTRPARPGHPAAVRGRAEPAERGPPGAGPRGRRRGSTQAVDDLDDTIKDIRRTIFALGSLDVVRRTSRPRSSGSSTGPPPR